MIATVLTLLIVVGGLNANECSPDWKLPEVHGIRLGMTVRQVKSILPFLKIPPADKYDVRWSFVSMPTGPAQRKRLPRVAGLEIWFWKNRVVRYNVEYFRPRAAQDLAQFVNAVETHFNLSSAMRVSAHRYQCGNVIISVAEDLKKTVSLRDAEGEKLLNRRVDESYGLKP